MIFSYALTEEVPLGSWGTTSLFGQKCSFLKFA